MPGLDGTGPARAGAMTGRGLGACAGGRGAGRGCGPGTGRGSGRGFGGAQGRGMGNGPGYGPGFGHGLGRGLGWFAVGCGEPAAGTASGAREILEERRAFLRAELARTEELLKNSPAAPEGVGEA